MFALRIEIAGNTSSLERLSRGGLRLFAKANRSPVAKITYGLFNSILPADALITFFVKGIVLSNKSNIAKSQSSIPHGGILNSDGASS